MRTAIVAFVLLVSVLALVIANSLILGNVIDSLCEKIQMLDTQVPSVAYAQIDAAYEYFRAKRGYVALTVSHSDITSIETSLSELMGAAVAEDVDSLSMIKSRLIGELTHLKRLSGINLDSVL
jgi:hypothetical protein